MCCLQRYSLVAQLLYQTEMLTFYCRILYIVEVSQLAEPYSRDLIVPAFDITVTSSWYSCYHEILWIYTCMQFKVYDVFCFVLVETNTLVLETNTVKMHVQISVTHTASYQQLPNKSYIELTSENVRFHTGEIRKLCRYITASFKAKFIIYM